MTVNLHATARLKGQRGDRNTAFGAVEPQMTHIVGLLLIIRHRTSNLLFWYVYELESRSSFLEARAPKSAPAGETRYTMMGSTVRAIDGPIHRSLGRQLLDLFATIVTPELQGADGHRLEFHKGHSRMLLL